MRLMMWLSPSCTAITGFHLCNPVNNLFGRNTPRGLLTRIGSADPRSISLRRNKDEYEETLGRVMLTMARLQGKRFSPNFLPGQTTRPNELIFLNIIILVAGFSFTFFSLGIEAKKALTWWSIFYKIYLILCIIHFVQE